MPYTALIIFVAYDVLPAASLNSNDANMDFLKTQVNTTLMQGRLTLETGVPVSTTDQTGKTTIYYSPFHGNLLGLKSGSSWDLYSFSEISLSLSGYIKGVCYDIFAYLSGGSPVLESLAWKKVTATNSPTSGSGKTINVNDTGDLAVGSEITVKDGAASEVTTVISLVANTSINCDLTNSYTTPDIYGFNTRATALTLDSGKWVKSGDATRRYLGTIRITTSTGQCEDSLSRRYVWNLQNRVAKPLYCKDTTDSWNYTTATWRAANASVTYGTGRVGFVVGLAENEVDVINTGIVANTASPVRFSVGIGINKTDTNSAQLTGGGAGDNVRQHHSVYYKGFPSIGYTYLQRLEYSEAGGTTTWYGDDNFTPFQSGLLAHLLM